MNKYSEREDEPEENYFISLSDLMTGVVFIFVILLCAFAFHYQTEAKTANAATAHAIDQKAKADAAAAIAAQATTDAATAKAAADKAETDAREKGRRIDALSKLLRERDDALDTILRELEGKLKAHPKHPLLVTLDPRRNGVIHLPEALLFDRASDVLSESGRQGLAFLAEELVPVLQRGCAEGSAFRLEAVFIEGHTDSDPVHTPRFADNWDLSAARATNTYRALTQARPELDSFRNPARLSVLGVSGYGENRPVELNDTEDHKKSNRRVDLRFLLARPTDAELERAREEMEGAVKRATPSPQ